jgi:hypothetical protein
MWRRVDLVWIDVSEERIASIFRVAKPASEEPAWAGGCRCSHRCENLKCYDIFPAFQKYCWLNPATWKRVICDEQGPDFDDMSPFFPCILYDAHIYIYI